MPDHEIALSRALSWISALTSRFPILSVVAGIGLLGTSFAAGMIWATGPALIHVIDKSRLFVELTFYVTLALLFARLLLHAVPILLLGGHLTTHLGKRLSASDRAQQVGRCLRKPVYTILLCIIIGFPIGVMVGLNWGWFQHTGLGKFLAANQEFLEVIFSGFQLFAMVHLTNLQMRRMRTPLDSEKEAVPPYDTTPALLSLVTISLAISLFVGGLRWVEWHRTRDSDIEIVLIDKTVMRGTAVMPADQGLIIFPEGDEARYIPLTSIIEVKRIMPPLSRAHITFGSGRSSILPLDTVKHFFHDALDYRCPLNADIGIEPIEESSAVASPRVSENLLSWCACHASRSTASPASWARFGQLTSENADIWMNSESNACRRLLLPFCAA